MNFRPKQGGFFVGKISQRQKEIVPLHILRQHFDCLGVLSNVDSVQREDRMFSSAAMCAANEEVPVGQDQPRKGKIGVHTEPRSHREYKPFVGRSLVASDYVLYAAWEVGWLFSQHGGRERRKCYLIWCAQ